MTTYEQIFIRSIVTLLLLMIVGRKQIKLAIPKNKIFILIICALAFPLSAILYTVSIETIKATNTIFALYIGSIFTSILIGFYFFKEKMTINKVISFVTILIAITIISYSSKGFSLLGIILVYWQDRRIQSKTLLVSI